MGACWMLRNRRPVADRNIKHSIACCHRIAGYSELLLRSNQFDASRKALLYARDEITSKRPKLLRELRLGGQLDQLLDRDRYFERRVVVRRRAMDDLDQRWNYEAMSLAVDSETKLVHGLSSLCRHLACESGYQQFVCRR
jgi:hypothetical protein